MAAKKKRADWRGGFDASPASRLHKLALHAKGNSADQRALRWALIQKGKFNEVLDEEVKNDKVDDITDAERAYCEGWAAMARTVFLQNDDPTDVKLVAAIQGEIDANKSNALSG